MVTPQHKLTPSTRYWQRSDFWKDSGERVVTAFLEGILTGVTIEALTTADVGAFKIVLAGSVAAAASTLKAIIGAQRSGSTTPVSIT